MFPRPEPSCKKLPAPALVVASHFLSFFVSEFKVDWSLFINSITILVLNSQTIDQEATDSQKVTEGQEVTHSRKVAEGQEVIGSKEITARESSSKFHCSSLPPPKPFGHNQHPLTTLSSFPGSGNTWTRLLLANLTG